MSETEKKLIEMLDNLLIYSGANSISLNTEDGLVIATNSTQNDLNLNIYISNGITTL